MTAERPAPPVHPAAPPTPPTGPAPAPVRQRSWAEIRWRQFRNAPRPIVRAVASSLIVAVVLAVLYVAYDIALSRGVALPGGDLRLLAITLYAVLVLLIGSVVTYLIVPQPTGSGTVVRRSGWSAALGFFAAVPIAWLVMVVAVQVIRPFMG
jgi:hypothetical protein